MKMFTVGPVACYPEVLMEMKHQMFSHRSLEYKTLHRNTVEMLQRLLETKHEVFFFPGSSSGFMEGAVRNCVDKKMLCCVNGSFGDRFADVAISNGKEVERLETRIGEPIEPDLLDSKLLKNPDVEAVSITHIETSMGLMNPLRKLAEVVENHGKLLFVDAVSSMGGVNIEVDRWRLDICFAGSQKCFGVPPGLAVGSVSDEALKRSEETKDKGWYFDFKLYKRHQKNAGTPMTPPIPQILGLNSVLRMIDDMGGKEQYFDLHSERSLRIRRGIKELGLTLFPKEGYESPTVTCVNAPRGINGVEVYNEMRKKGFELAKGFGEVMETTFRIGNMGHLVFEDIESMLKALEEVLSFKQFK